MILFSRVTIRRPLTHQFRQDPLDRPPSHYRKRVTPISGDDLVLSIDRRFHANGDCFLADGEVAEPADELLLVERVGSLFHPAHLSLCEASARSEGTPGKMEVVWRRTDHLLIQVHQDVLAHFGVERGSVASVRVEGVLGELNLELSRDPDVTERMTGRDMRGGRDEDRAVRLQVAGGRHG